MDIRPGEVTVALIYHGAENGNREDGNIFHEVPEVWLDPAEAALRFEHLERHYANVRDGFVHRIDVPRDTPLGRYGFRRDVP